MIETIRWTDAGVVMIDQRKLPREEQYVTCTDYGQVAEAIRTMAIRAHRPSASRRPWESLLECSMRARPASSTKSRKRWRALGLRL